MFLVTGVLTVPFRWSVASNDRALANARAATTECSRVRLERAEVEAYLASRFGGPAQVELVGR